MRITLIISSLGPGGAERVLSIMANHWQQHGWAVTMLTLDDGKTPPFYPLSPAIQRRALNIFQEPRSRWERVSNIVRRFLVMRRALQASQPDAVVSFIDQTNVRVLVAMVGLRLPVIVCERVDPKLYSLRWSWHWLRRLTYPYASRLVVQSANARAYFSPRVQAKTQIIPNPVLAPPTMRTAARNHDSNFTIVAMGRCVPQKGFDLLLNAFAQIAATYPQWIVTIIGDGPVRLDLEQQAAQLGVAAQVQFTGLVRDPASYLATADLFVLSSRFEGFPNALCEAMACGLPVISFDCPSGPAEIIRHGVDGFLVPAQDVNALAATMGQLITDVELRSRLAARALEIVERFGVTKVMDLWTALIEEVVQPCV